MVNRNNAAQKYIHSVNKALPCSYPIKRQIISQLRGSITEHMMQNPEADVAALNKHFGTPEQIASSYLENQESSDLLKKMNTKKKLISVVTGSVVILLLTWFGLLAWSSNVAHTNLNGNIEVITEHK